MEKRFENVSEYTKSESPEERSKVASEIKEQRKSAFDKKADLAKRIENLSQEIESSSESLQEVLAEVEDISATIEKNKNGWVSSIFNHFKTEQLKSDLKGKELRVKDLEGEIDAMGNYRADVESILSESDHLEGAKEKLKSFYGNQTEEWNTYESECALNDLTNIAEKENVVVVHKIFEDVVTGGNSPLESHADFETKLQIVLGLEPTLAASFVKEGVTQKLFGGEGAGVIFSGGEIVHAGTGDAGTKPTGLNSREGSFTEEKLVSEEVKETIADLPSRERYSEVILRKPEVAGLFYSLESNLPEADAKAKVEMYGEMAKKYNLPLYKLQKGAFVSVENGEVFSSKELVSQKHERSEEDKKLIVENILESGAFKTNSPEKNNMAAWSKGKQAYMELGGEKARALLDYNEKGVEFFNLRTPVRYSLRNGEFAKQTEFMSGNERKQSEIVSYLDRATDEDKRTGSGGYLQINNQRYLKLREDNKSFSGPVELVESIKTWVDSNQEEISKGVTGKEIGSFLFGLSEQAASAGDTDVAESSKGLAEQLFSSEEFQSVLKKRIGEDGKFRCTQEDIDNIGK